MSKQPHEVPAEQTPAKKQNEKMNPQRSEDKDSRDQAGKSNKNRDV